MDKILSGFKINLGTEDGKKLRRLFYCLWKAAEAGEQNLSATNLKGPRTHAALIPHFMPEAHKIIADFLSRP
ncbi:MAG: hypothetical protein ACHQPI_10530 [Thermoanaerobaculia bacterium]